jgi:hypothetical protein
MFLFGKSSIWGLAKAKFVFFHEPISFPDQLMIGQENESKKTNTGLELGI